jgi:uncharacterized protein
MSKFIVFLVVVALLYVLLRTKTGRRARGQHRPRRETAPEAFVTCTHCGVNVPSSEAVTFEGRNYCCEEHRPLG